MSAHDAFGAHSRDELHITEMTSARPVVAALASAATFTAGALLPLLIVVLVPRALVLPGEVIASILFLAALGAIGAVAGGARPWKPVARVMFWGLLAMALTAGIGRIVGTAI